MLRRLYWTSMLGCNYMVENGLNSVICQFLQMCSYARSDFGTHVSVKLNLQSRKIHPHSDVQTADCTNRRYVVIWACLYLLHGGLRQFQFNNQLFKTGIFKDVRVDRECPCAQTFLLDIIWQNQPKHLFKFKQHTGQLPVNAGFRYTSPNFDPLHIFWRYPLIMNTF